MSFGGNPFSAGSPVVQQIDLLVQADPTGTMQKFTQGVADAQKEIDDLRTAFQAGTKTADDFDREMKDLTADLQRLQAAQAAVERATRTGTSAGADSAQQMRQGTQALQGFSRGFEDVVLSGGRFSSMVNNIPQLVTGVAGAMGRSAASAAAWASGIGLAATAALALAPVVRGLWESFAESNIEATDSQLERMTKRIDELKDKKVRLAIDDAELERLQIDLDKANKALETFNALMGRQTAAESKSGKRVGEILVETPGARDAIDKARAKLQAETEASNPELVQARSIIDFTRQQIELKRPAAAAGDDQARGDLAQLEHRLAEFQERARKLVAGIAQGAKQTIGEIEADAEKGTGPALAAAQAKLAGLLRANGAAGAADQIGLVSPDAVKRVEAAGKALDAWKTSLADIKEEIKDIPLDKLDEGMTKVQERINTVRAAGQAVIDQAGPMTGKDKAKLQGEIDQGVGGLRRDAQNRVDAAQKKAADGVAQERENQVNEAARIYKAKLKASLEDAVARGMVSGAADADILKSLSAIIDPAMVAGHVDPAIAAQAGTQAAQAALREIRPGILARPGATPAESARGFLEDAAVKQQRRDEAKTPAERRITELAKTIGAGGANDFAGGLIAQNEAAQNQWAMMAPDEQRAARQMAAQRARLQREDERQFRLQLGRSRLSRAQKAQLIQQRQDQQAQMLPGVPLNDQALGNVVGGRLAERISGMADAEGNPIGPEDAQAIAAEILQNQGGRFNARQIGQRLGAPQRGRGMRSVGIGPEQPVSPLGAVPDIASPLERSVNVGARAVENTSRLLAIATEADGRLAALEMAQTRQAQELMRFAGSRSGRRSFGRAGIR